MLGGQANIQLRNQEEVKERNDKTKERLPNGSGVSREAPAPFCERPEGKFLWPTHHETFNTLKNQGYQFEHNFGHGYKNLSHVFGLLMFLAFLIDQVQQRCCGLFQEALEKAKRKIRFWEKLRMYFLEFYIDSWTDLYAAMSKKRGMRFVELTDTS